MVAQPGKAWKVLAAFCVLVGVSLGTASPALAGIRSGYDAAGVMQGGIVKDAGFQEFWYAMDPAVFAGDGYYLEFLCSDRVPVSHPTTNAGMVAGKAYYGPACPAGATAQHASLRHGTINSPGEYIEIWDHHGEPCGPMPPAGYQLVGAPATTECGTFTDPSPSPTAEPSPEPSPSPSPTTDGVLGQPNADGTCSDPDGCTTTTTEPSPSPTSEPAPSSTDVTLTAAQWGSVEAALGALVFFAAAQSVMAWRSGRG